MKTKSTNQSIKQSECRTPTLSDTTIWGQKSFQNDSSSRGISQVPTRPIGIHRIVYGRISLLRKKPGKLSHEADSFEAVDGAGAGARQELGEEAVGAGDACDAAVVRIGGGLRLRLELERCARNVGWGVRVGAIRSLRTDDIAARAGCVRCSGGSGDGGGDGRRRARRGDGRRRTGGDGR